MNTVKNQNTIYLGLNQVNVLEVVILLMNCLIEYVFQIKQFQIYMFLIRLQEKNESKTLTKDIIKFDEKKSTLDQWQNNNKYQCGRKKCHIYDKECTENPTTCSCENKEFQQVSLKIQ